MESATKKVNFSPCVMAWYLSSLAMVRLKEIHAFQEAHMILALPTISSIQYTINVRIYTINALTSQKIFD